MKYNCHMTSLMQYIDEQSKLTNETKTNLIILTIDLWLLQNKGVQGRNQWRVCLPGWMKTWTSGGRASVLQNLGDL